MEKGQDIDKKELDKLIAYCNENKYSGEHRPLTFAAVLLRRDHLRILSMFYTFFCYCDDEIDQVQSKEAAKEKIESFRNYYKRIINGETISFEESPTFAAIQYAMRQTNIPHYYFENLFSSMKMDINNHIYNTLNDLKFYCYLATGLGMVAFCHVVGVSSEEAVHYAMYYGVSSQLTNTARDILVDAKIGRIYIPVEWLNEYRIPLKDITNPIYRNQLHSIAKRIAHLAEIYMKKGDQSLPFLSFSSACTLSLARQLDAAICHAICKQDLQVWEKGVSLSLGVKTLSMFIAIARVLKAHRYRLFKKFKAVPVHKIWDFESQHENEEV